MVIQWRGKVKEGASSARSRKEVSQMLDFLGSSGRAMEMDTRTHQAWVTACAWISISIKTFLRDFKCVNLHFMFKMHYRKSS